MKPYIDLYLLNGLRSSIKRMLMGDYVSPLLNLFPTHNKKYALINCKVFDGIQPTLSENMTVLIDGAIISDVGNKEKVSIPEDFVVYDLEGQTLMPGMVDNHAHVFSPFTYIANFSAVRQMPAQIALNMMQTVYNGITTVCDMGGPQGFIKEFTNLSDQNQIPGPRFLNCFTLICPRRGKKLGYPSQVKVLNPLKAWLLEGQVATRPKTIEELKKICYQVKNDGGTHLKTTYQPYPFSRKKHTSQDDFPIFDDEWMKTIFKIGKEIDLVVDIHAPCANAAEKCVDLSIDIGAKIRIQHISFDHDLENTFFQKMRDNGFFIIPTVMAFGDAFHLLDFISWLDTNPKTHMMTEATKQMRSRIQNAIDSEPYSGQLVMDCDYPYLRENFCFIKRNTQRAHDARIIGIGTDMGGTNTGFFGRFYTEIKYYLDFGISIEDIMKYLTSINAQINDLTDRGVIQRGKLADLIGIIGNPFNNPLALTKVATVMKGGHFLKRLDMATSPLLN